MVGWKGLQVAHQKSCVGTASFAGTSAWEVWAGPDDRAEHEGPVVSHAPTDAGLQVHSHGPKSCLVSQISQLCFLSLLLCPIRSHPLVNLKIAMLYIPEICGYSPFLSVLSLKWL